MFSQRVYFSEHSIKYVERMHIVTCVHMQFSKRKDCILILSPAVPPTAPPPPRTHCIHCSVSVQKSISLNDHLYNDQLSYDYNLVNPQ